MGRQKEEGEQEKEEGRMKPVRVMRGHTDGWTGGWVRACVRAWVEEVMGKE